MSTKKIEGYVSDATMHSSQDAGGLWLFTDRVTKNPGTLVIHSGKSEPVYTHSEVRQFALDMISASEDGPHCPNTEAMEACAKKFLTTL